MKDNLNNTNDTSLILPKMGKMYDCYDDGKLSESRRYKVYIYDILKASDALKDFDLKRLWQLNIEDHDYLFNVDSPYFIIGISHEQICPKVEVFALTRSNTWFGLGELIFNQIDEKYEINNTWCAGLLDINLKKDFEILSI